MAEKLLKKLIETNDNVEYFEHIIYKTEEQLYKNIDIYFRNFLKHHEEPLDVVHSECTIKYDNAKLWVSCIDLNENDEIVVILSDISFSNDTEVLLKNFDIKEVVEIYWAVSRVIETILARELNV